MELEQFFGMTFKGNKRFSHQDIATTDDAGFSTSADEHMENGIDLNEQLIQNKAATFFMRVSGDAMTGAGIFHGDVVIVDRSMKASNGKVVIASLNGEMLIRRFEKTINRVRLVPETPKLSAIDVDLSGSEFSIWGVVTYVIHSL
ncbi:MAG TPA: translesion error-prone DNA polymerase V autoproteolytic subunit [Puia sp.]|jgi:DNA polymerase V